MDLTTLTDDELNSHLNDVLNEKERRNRLTLIPAQVTALTQQYTQDGGDITVIQQAIQ